MAGINTILKEEVGDVLLALSLAGIEQQPEYHRALLAVAVALGLSEVAQQLEKAAGGE